MDLLQFEENISSDARLIYRNIDKMIADNDLVSKVNQWFLDRTFPKDEVVRILNMADLMRLDTVIGEEYGCFKASYADYGAVCRKLEGDMGGDFRSFLPSVTKGLVRYVLYQFGSEEQKQKYLPGLADGSLIGCFALTGPPGGSDPQYMQMRAYDDGDHSILLGEKNWITNGSIADVIIVWANTRSNQDPNGIRAFIVERGEKGLEQKEIKGKISLCASDTGNIFFRDCRIHKSALLPGTEGGIKTAYQCLNQARFSIGWGAIGVAEACFHDALIFAGERMITDENGNKIPLKKTQSMMIDFAYMDGCIEDMRERAFHVARDIDKAGGITLKIAKSISRLKLSNVDGALFVANKARQILGANGLQIDGTNRIPRHFLNMFAVETYEGTPRMHALILGTHATR